MLAADLAGRLCAYEDRPAHLLYVRSIAPTLDDARHAVDAIVALLWKGRRPRYGREIGLTAEAFGVKPKGVRHEGRT
jgi:hypothetical protein